MDIVNREIERYAEAHSQVLPALLDELTGVTKARFGRQAGMISGPLTGALLQILAASVQARRILEIGMFTGFSALMMAAALPEDGELITCDVNVETSELARGFFDRSSFGKKITIRLGPALETVETLQGPFDLVFIDADKENYRAYYEAALPLLAPNGVIAVDNVLWSGRVLDPKDASDRAIAEFNDHVQRDQRVTNVLLSVRDGVSVPATALVLLRAKLVELFKRHELAARDLSAARFDGGALFRRLRLVVFGRLHEGTAQRVIVTSTKRVEDLLRLHEGIGR